MPEDVPDALPATTTRCRFAPSPTGFLHVGGARTVLFNWLFARHTGGKFLLRVEDTDLERNRPELIEAIYDSMKWLGLEWDEVPVHQSERFAEYIEAADLLFKNERAYYCDCTAEAVQARNQEAGGPPGYDGFCRDRGLEQADGRALRFRAPDEGTTTFDDLVRGHVEFRNDTIEDFVLLRGNGTPVFLLANVVDDHFQGITHVIRGEEHVNGTPKYLLIGDAMGLDYRPAFAHLPLLVNEQRKKLSKRRDDVAVGDFRTRGYLPEAMVNHLALLGWGPADGVEIRPLAEIVDLFRLEDVNQSPAFFDPKKLDHINGEYIRALSPGEFLARADEFLPTEDEAPGVRDALSALAVEVRDRVKTLVEAAPMVEFLWRDEPVRDDAAWDKVIVRGKAAAEMLDATIARLDALEPEAWEMAPEVGDEPGATRAPALKEAVLAAAVDAGLVNAEGKPQLSKAQAPVRVAITGTSVGPPLFESLAALGRDRALARLRTARASVT